MRTRLMLIPVLVLGAVVASARGGPQEDAEFTADFGFGPRQTFQPHGKNKYFSLEPGTFHRYEGPGDAKGDLMVIEVTVLDEVRPFLFRANDHWIFAVTRAIEEREWLNGELFQVSINYFARCPRTGSIFYFGEDVDHYENGAIVGHEGSWLAGQDGAQPGLHMPGMFLIGSRYCQEMAPGVSMDRAENVAMNVVIETPAGLFQNGITVLETTPLEPEEETLKVYAEGVGLVADEDLVLVEYR